jgi:UDP-N-acetyl-2-amino-2-deoxyglucuronate dehydrogenase
MLNIGLIGCGRISQNHFEAIAAQPDASCLACCDIVEDRARQAAERYHIPQWSTDYGEMLANPDLDLIAVCTPSGLHPQHGILAAQAGKHVLTEKPMACSLQEGDQLIKACATAGVKLFVVLQNRLNPSIQLLRRAYGEGRFGQIFMISSNVFWHRPQDYYDLASWRGTWALDGGAFMNQASHYVDMVQWFGGPVAEVKALTATLARNIEAEDTGAAIIRFASGAIGSINVTTLTYPKNLEGSITILGARGTVVVAGTSMNRIDHWEFADKTSYDQDIKHFNTAPDSVYGYGHKGYYRNVIDCLLNRAQALSDGIEGRKSLHLLEEIYQNIKPRQPGASMS